MAQESVAIDATWKIFAGKFRRFHGLGAFFYVKNPSIILRNIRDLFLFFVGCLQSLWLLIWWRPNVVFVKGGFVGLPVGLAAACLRIPIVTHDSDTVPGLTNRILSRYARYNAVAMPEQYYTYQKNKVRYTGLPIRDVFRYVTPKLQNSARQSLGIPADSLIVAVVGGSLGATRLNDAVAAIMPDFMSQVDNRWLLHQTGGYHLDTINKQYAALPKSQRERIKTWDFLPDIQTVTAAADIIISRAGSSIHEFSAQHKAVILVPNPMLTGAHQTVNARVLSERGAAMVVSETELTDTHNLALLHALDYLANHKNQRNQLAESLGSLAVPDATKRIVAVIMEAAR